MAAQYNNDMANGGGDFGAHMERIRTAGSVNISTELFEKLYLSPQNAVSGEFRQTFGNPTPIALAGFLLSLTPLSMALLEWCGAGGLGAAMNEAFFMTFGAFSFNFGATPTPYYNASAAYSPDPEMPWEGAVAPEFMATFAFFLISMDLLCFVHPIASILTNLVFFFIFSLIVPAFGCLAGSFWPGAQGDTALSLALQHADTGLALALSLLGWYILTALILAGVKS
ncbi:uncharacterized protein MYCGRDRAFT_109328 [Zymoseptoria tritici IPO323]|uniref:Uncharacterized protein n=1 Tax=Zymoseptoria tritici (strain CBS 115943 / IPO323) TaxID=336722 RepID=F9XAI2_ZYMTI|nr:uncharacterized protein MYCGRDRAFT_109328 [Zymoseptoria tritici IPO323]EGP86997.1 hypothetical protein MYCGRDRAFT_109328 [Zymoseptoria tritici IPO323]